MTCLHRTDHHCLSTYDQVGVQTTSESDSESFLPPWPVAHKISLEVVREALVVSKGDKHPQQNF